LRSKL